MSVGMVQASDLEVHEVPDGYIVYQKQRDRVHYLNKTAALIFEFCDGVLQPRDIVEQVARIYALDASGYDEIRAALDSLVQEGLVLSP
ncbi:MAG: PqqD family protein [Xanthobacteraceae bacterium]